MIDRDSTESTTKGMGMANRLIEVSLVTDLAKVGHVECDRKSRSHALTRVDNQAFS
jgi:hypothetical protein